MHSRMNTHRRSQILNLSSLSGYPSLQEIALFGLKAALWLAMIPLVLGLALKLWG